MLKLCIVLITTSILTIDSAPFDKKNIEIVGKLCRAETGMDKDELDKALSKQTIPKSSETYLNYLKCTYKKQGYLDEKNRIDFDEIGSMLTNFYSDFTVSVVLESCKMKSITEPAELEIYKTARCIIDGLKNVEENYDNNIA